MDGQVGFIVDRARRTNTWSINGAVAFIRSIANATPSGYAPQERMMNTIRPTPEPNTTSPTLCPGEVTGSVAIKKAVSMLAPVNKVNAGEPRLADEPPS